MPVEKRTFGKSEGDPACFAGLQFHSLEALEFTERSRGVLAREADVELHDGRAGPGPRVRDIHPDPETFRYWNHLHARHRKASVTEPVAEGKEGVAPGSVVAPVSVEDPFMVVHDGPVFSFGKITRVMAECRILVDRPVKGAWKMSGGILGSEENRCQGGARFLTEIPCLENGGDLPYPWSHVDGRAPAQDDDGSGIRLGDFQDELLLLYRQGEPAVESLTLHVRVESDADDGNIRSARGNRPRRPLRNRNDAQGDPAPAPTNLAGRDPQWHPAPLTQGHHITVRIAQFTVAETDFRVPLGEQFVVSRFGNLNLGIPDNPGLLAFGYPLRRGTLVPGNGDFLLLTCGDPRDVRFGDADHAPDGCDFWRTWNGFRKIKKTGG